MGRRTLLLIAAIVLAAIGTTLVFFYVDGINERAIADQQPTKVLVATQLVAAGTTGAAAASAGSFELKAFPKAAVVSGALSDVTPINNLVAKAPIFPGEQILLDKFGAPGTTQAVPVPAGKVAVSVQLSDPARVAGFVSPGGRVAIYASVDGAPVPGTKVSGTAATGNASQAVTAVLLPAADVVAVGATTVVPVTRTDATGEAQTEQIPKTIITLALTPQDAQKLIWASQQGELYFALVTKDSGVSKGPGTTIGNLFQ